MTRSYIICLYYFGKLSAWFWSLKNGDLVLPTTPCFSGNRLSLLQCFLCKRALKWIGCDDDDNDGGDGENDEGVEILSNCSHAFHKTCLDAYVKDNDEECPHCLRVFRDDYVLDFSLLVPVFSKMLRYMDGLGALAPLLPWSIEYWRH